MRRWRIGGWRQPCTTSRRGNTHNQASVSLVDRRELAERLNKESGLEVKIP